VTIATALGLAVGSCGSAAQAAAPRQWRVSAWTEGDVASLQTATRAQALDEVSADCWNSNPNGTVDTSASVPALVTLAHSKGLRILATVSNWSNRENDFDPAIAATILGSRSRVALQVATLVSDCVAEGYDGVDLDWESLAPAQRDRFSRFVARLAAGLHAQGKLVSIAVAAKTDDQGTWDGAESEDYAALGNAVDEFKIMTYDYSGSWSGPGPISPTSWMERVLRYAETRVSPAKIWLGVPFYGCDWQGTTAGSPAPEITYRSAQRLLRRYRARVRHLSCGEATFTYKRARVRHVVVFQDRVALAAKLAVLTRLHPGIAGICIWRMGGEDPRFWTLIDSRLGRTTR